MIIINGILRQSGEITIGEEKKKMMKLWVEHESPGRENQPGDLKIEELLIPSATVGKLPGKGESVNVAVRPYVSGRSVAFSAIGLAGTATGGAASQKGA